MKNNRLRLIKNDGGNPKTVRARNRLIRLYNALRRKGGWRAVQKERGARNVAIVYNFAVHGDEPSNLEDRMACFLPKHKPKPRVVKERPAAPSQEWWERVAKLGIRVMVKEMKKSVKEVR